MNTQTIKLDINKRLYQRITAKQGDTKSRFLLFHLLDGAVPFSLTGRTVRVYGLKPDNKEIFNDLQIVDADKGHCKLELTNQALAIKGDLELELAIYEGESKLTSIPFTVEVIKSINSTNAIESSNEYKALDEALIKTDKWNSEFADKSGKIEQLYTERLNEINSHLEEKAKQVDLNTTNIKVANLETLKANKTDLTSNKIFKGSDTTANILLKTGVNGDYYYSTDEKVYYLKSDSGWINIGYGDNKINSIIFTPIITEEGAKYLRYDGAVVSNAPTNFKIATFSVVEYEKYEITSRYVDAQRMYCFYDSNNRKILIYPDSTNNIPNTSETIVVGVPQNAVKMIVSSYIDNIKVIKLPITDLKLVEDFNIKINNLNTETKNISNMQENISLENVNKYINHMGNVASLTNDLFAFKQIIVKTGERYRIKGSCRDYQRLYSFMDINNNVISVFPINSDAIVSTISYDTIITVPENAVILNVSSYTDFTENITRLPVLSLPKENVIEKKIFENKTLLLNSIFCVGDSLTSGAYYNSVYNGKSIKESYPYYLSKLSKCNVVNGGWSGYSASNWWNTAMPKYDLSKYDTFIIWLGTNNGLTDTLATDVDPFTNYNDFALTETGYYCKIISKIKEINPEANIFLITIFASKGNVPTTNSVISKIATKYNIGLININSDGKLYPSDIYHPFGNTVHFGKVGNLEVATRIYDFINSYISIHPANFEKVLLGERTQGSLTE